MLGGRLGSSANAEVPNEVKSSVDSREIEIKSSLCIGFVTQVSRYESNDKINYPDVNRQ